MISSESLLGALAAIFGIAWIIHSAIGIRRRQIATYGRDNANRGQHGHKAVREGLIRVLGGATLLLFGICLLVSGV
jgi:uncharacterized protein HemY